jgi:hypothetical protein
MITKKQQGPGEVNTKVNQLEVLTKQGRLYMGLIKQIEIGGQTYNRYRKH